MNLFRLYNVVSLRSNGEASQRILSGKRAHWHAVPTSRGGTNESGPASARYSEVLAGHYVMLEGGMFRKVTEMQTWGDLGGGLNSESDVSPRAGLQHSNPRSRSPHSSDDPQVSKASESKGGQENG